MPTQNYYWYEGKKIPITVSEQQKAVKFTEQNEEANFVSRSATIQGLVADSGAVDLGNGIVLFNNAVSGIRPNAMQALQDTQSGVVELPVFKSTGHDETLVGNTEFMVKFRKTTTTAEAQKILQQHGAEVKEPYKWDADTFVAEAIAGKNVVDVANDVYEKEQDKVEYAQPNFVRLFKPFFIPNDALFTKQWALRNTGQTGGISGQDIQCVPAWDSTRGAATITIAIIDEGVDYTHEDLNVAGKLVPGYDAITHTNNCNPENDDAHGTSCAGIATGGGNNSLGISGVAPNCRLMGVRIAKKVSGNWVTTDAQIADGINTAVARGADVLSNSWGGGSPSTLITNAIRNAKTTGRGGKGCVVCFAAGNFNTAVSYPGNLPEVITVAACNEYGERKSPTSRDGETWGSNFGPEVDVCAPGVHIVTTDISGARGYTPNNYTETFNGTSAATPHVSGVAALVLSVNSNFTAAQVEAILRASTDDLGTAGYDVYTGSGRINAKKAVDNAQSWKRFTLSPAGTAAPAGSITAVSRIPGSMEVFWIGPDGSIRDSYWYDGVGWRTFILAAAGSAAVNGCITAVSRIPGSMEVFWIGPDGSIRDAYWYDGVGWRFFILAAAGSASVNGSITVASRIPTSMEVFWTGPDGSIRDAYWYDGAGWRFFTLSAAGTASVNGSIKVISRIPTSMEVFWIGPDGSIRDAYWYDGAGWRFFTLSAAGTAATAGCITGVARIPGSMELFWTGPDGSIRDAYWYDGAGWRFFTLSAAGTASVNGSITVASRIPTSMEVFWTGPDGSVRDAYWYDGAGWHFFTLAAAGSASTSGSMKVVARIPGSMELFWTGADGSIQDAYWYA